MVESTEGGGGWWSRHGLVVFILAVAASLAFLLRVLYSYQLIPTCDVYYCFAGGSDSFYHARVMQYIITYHTNLIHDAALNYPLGYTNPREPLFDWMNAILGILSAPFFGGNAVKAGSWWLEMQPPIWSALGVFPVYLLGKEVSGRRMGLLAAILFPLIVGNMESSVATYANYLSFYAFFVVLSLALYIHTVKLAGSRRWVESYRSPRSVWVGLKSFLRTEEMSVRWAVFTGVTLGATMLAWQGYTYVVAVVVIFLALLVVIERIRGVDSFGPYIVTLIVGTVAFLMAMPYYYVQGDFGYWFTVPVLLWFGGLLVLLPFLFLRNSPWVISVPTLFLSVLAAAGGLFLYNPAYFDAVLTGQGYFVKTLIYSTVAEAQAPSFDSLIVSYGVLTFFLAFAGLAIFLFYLYSHRFRREHLFMVIFGLLGIYLPISAAKFFLLGSPVFALLPAEVVLVGVDRLGLPQMRRNFFSLSARGNRLLALRRSVKLRHVALGLLIVALLLPNVWYATDAAIPSNLKSQYNEQVYNSLPGPLQTSSANASSAYFGAAGIQTDTPQQYDESGYNWLAQQDTNILPISARPAFISWWDYGFQALDQGQHPTVADNFQDGIAPAGAFLLSQNESQAIAVMATDLLSAESQTSGHPYLPSALNTILARDGVNLTLLHTYLVNQSRDVPIVLDHPSVYGEFDAATISPLSAMYAVVSNFLASTLSENSVVKVYQDVQSYTGWSIRYAMSNSLMFPTSGSSTGIFYAPADLTGRVISSGGIPTQFFQVTVLGTDGNTYILGQQPSSVGVVSYNITYYPSFYNSMIYRFYAGYNGTDVGAGAGIPGLTSSLSNYQPEPGWMMQHFVQGYRTAYWCPYKDYQAHPNCFVAVNYAQAAAAQASGNGTADLSPTSYYSAGETIMEYYPGATVTGAVTLPDGTPVQGLQVTILDQYGIPHMTTTTNAQGVYSLIAPPGPVTVAVSYGALNPLTQIGAYLVAERNFTVTEAQAYQTDPSPILQGFTVPEGVVSGQAYYNVEGIPAYAPTDPVVASAPVLLTSLQGGKNYSTRTDASGYYQINDVVPGSYEVRIRVGNALENYSTLEITRGGAVTKDLPLHPGKVFGAVRDSAGAPVSGAEVSLVFPATGSVRTFLTNTTGNFTFSPVDPGNYTLRANTSAGLASIPAHVAVAGVGLNVSANLTLELPVAVGLNVSYLGHPLPNVPVRFSPLGGITNATSAANQSFVFYSNSAGTISAEVPEGNWSVYALAAVNGTYVAGLGDLSLPAGQGTIDAGTLVLAPATVVRGATYITGNPAPQGGVGIVVQSSAGAVMPASANATGLFQLFLPQGSYSFLATYPPTSAVAKVALTSVIVGSSPTTVNLNLGSAFSFSPQVGYANGTGKLSPLPGARVNVTLSPGSVPLQLITGRAGNVSARLPVGSGVSYSLTVQRAGYLPYVRTGLSSTALGALLQIPLTPAPVNVTVNVLGLPSGSGTPVVNMTSTSGASSKGGTSVTFAVSPGLWAVDGYALGPAPNRTLYRPLAPIPVSVPLGSGPISVNAYFYEQLSFQGNLTAALNNATLNSGVVRLFNSSVSGNLSLNGVSFRAPFKAPSGNYTLWAIVRTVSQDYAYFGPVNLAGVSPTNGTLTPSKLVLRKAGTVALRLTTGNGSTPVDLSLPFTLTNRTGGGSNGSLPWSFGPQGTVELTLPPGTYSAGVDALSPWTPPGGVERNYTFVSGSNATCTVTAGTSVGVCKVYVRSALASTPVAFSLSLGGVSPPGGGTLWISPALNGSGTRAYALSGPSFSLALTPGTYYAYAVYNPSGAPLAGFTRFTLPYSTATYPVALSLSAAWSQSFPLSSPASLPTPRSVNLTLTNGRTGWAFELGAYSVGTSADVYLPPGAFEVNFSAHVAPFGPRVDLNFGAGINVTSANRALPAPLAPVYQPAATLTVQGNGNFTTVAGSNVSVTLALRNTGNQPLNVTLNGTPSNWPIRFSPGNFTVDPGPNGVQYVEVRVGVPGNVLSTHPPLVFSAYQVGNTTAALVQYTLPLNLYPVYGLRAGPQSVSPTVGPTSIILPFYVGGAGNTPSTVSVSVANGAVLQQDGWSYSITDVSGNALPGSFTATPGGAVQDAQVRLFSRTSAPVVPSAVMLYAADLTFPAASLSFSLHFPSATALGLNGTLSVTGPGVGGPAPNASLPLIYATLAVVPGIAIVGAAWYYRWLKTRRWVRR